MDANILKRRTVSRISYYALCALNYITFLLLSDVFFVDLMQYAGFTDATIGIISSALGFATFVQLILLFIGHKIRRRKAVILFGFTGMPVMFVFMHLIALMPMNLLLKQFLMIAALLIGRLVCNFASPVFDIFKYSFISFQERGAVIATNQAVSLATAIVSTLAIGAVRDYYREAGNVEQGLFVTAIFLGVVTVLTAISVLLMRGSSSEAENTRSAGGVKEIFQNTLGSKSFLCMLLFYILWQVANSITNNFWGLYKLNELRFSISTVQIINTTCNILAMLLVRPLGKLADKYTHSLLLKFSLIGYVISFTIGAFTSPDCAWLAVVQALVGAIPGVILGACFFNVLLDYTGATYYMYSIALTNCISNACSFGISFIAAWLLETIQSMGNTLFGMTVYAQQILSAISAVLTLGLLGFAHFVFTKLPKQNLTDTNKD